MKDHYDFSDGVRGHVFKQFPTLYKKTSTGAQQEWTIEMRGGPPGPDFECGLIITRWGQTGGAIQETTDVVREGKNSGRSNATTPRQQAAKEAQALYEKKLKKGYHPKANAAMAGETHEIIEGGITPMLAHRFDQHGHKIKWPAYIQPKLDGHRCIAILKDGKCTLWSRTRKRITGVPHIERAIERMDRENDLILDGELYNHSYRNNFEELTSFIRSQDPKPGHEVVEFHVYDLPSAEAGFGARHAALHAEMVHAYGGPLKLVETTLVRDEDEMMLAFENLTAAGGYEGVMVRNAEGLYVNKRSYDLLKVKEFQDAEYSIVGVEEGRGKLAGHAIFVCETPSARSGMVEVLNFNVKMKGETSELKKYWDDPSLAIGKQLTVKYQGLTSDGLPRFPVGIRLRDDV